MAGQVNYTIRQAAGEAAFEAAYAEGIRMGNDESQWQTIIEQALEFAQTP